MLSSKQSSAREHGGHLGPVCRSKAWSAFAFFVLMRRDDFVVRLPVVGPTGEANQRIARGMRQASTYCSLCFEAKCFEAKAVTGMNAVALAKGGRIQQ